MSFLSLGLSSLGTLTGPVVPAIPAPDITGAGSLAGTGFQDGEQLTITEGTATPSNGGVISYEYRHRLADGTILAATAAYTHVTANVGETAFAEWRAVETPGTATSWQVVGTGEILAATGVTAPAQFGPNDWSVEISGSNFVVDFTDAIALTTPVDFGVQLYFDATKASGSKYYINEPDGSHELAQYTGGTVYVSPSGDDTTGDGTSGNPLQTIDEAVSQASSGDRISLAPGIYATPLNDINKNLAFVREGSGLVFIGEFNDLSTAQVDPAGTLWNVDDVGGGGTFAGFVLTDGTLVEGVRGSADAADNNLAIAQQARGTLSVFSGGSSANFSTGGLGSLPDLITAGAILAWTDTHRERFVIASGATVYIGPEIVLAGDGEYVVEALGTANLVLDRAEVYGGRQGIEHAGSGYLRLYGTKHAGAWEDNIDYKGTATGLEVGIISVNPGSAVADNASTAHEGASVLRVGGTYAGGSRTIHDVGTGNALVLSSTIRDAYHGDQVLLRAGLNPDALTLTYGDLTFAGDRLTDLEVSSASTANDADTGWPLDTASVPEDNGSPILGYKVRIAGSIVQDVGLTDPATVTPNALTDTVEVLAYNSGGDGPWSAAKTATATSSVSIQSVAITVTNGVVSVQINATGASNGDAIAGTVRLASDDSQVATLSGTWPNEDLTITPDLADGTNYYLLLTVGDSGEARSADFAYAAAASPSTDTSFADNRLEVISPAAIHSFAGMNTSAHNGTDDILICFGGRNEAIGPQTFDTASLNGVAGTQLISTPAFGAVADADRPFLAVFRVPGTSFPASSTLNFTTQQNVTGMGASLLYVPAGSTITPLVVNARQFVNSQDLSGNTVAGATVVGFAMKNSSSSTIAYSGFVNSPQVLKIDAGTDSGQPAMGVVFDNNIAAETPRAMSVDLTAFSSIASCAFLIERPQ